MRRSVAGALALVALVGCHRGDRRIVPAIAAIDAAPAATSDASTPWAGLFAGPGTYVYDVTTDSLSVNEDGSSDNDVTTEPLSCQRELVALGRYRLVRLRCAGAFEGRDLLELLDDVFVTDGERLWWLDDPEATTEAEVAAALADVEPDLIRDQAPVHEEDDDNPDSEFASVGYHEVTAEGRGWCAHWASPGPHVSTRRYCLDPEVGLTRIEWGEDGSEFLGYTAVLRPR